MMDKNKVKKKVAIERKSVSMQLPLSLHRFVKENGFSFIRVLTEGCKELGYKEEPK
jgi:peroxiredoxin